MSDTDGSAGRLPVGEHSPDSSRSEEPGKLVSLDVASRLTRAIRTGRYPVGSRLPNEHDLARDFGVSRPSLREALAALQFAGYVESRRGSGTLVMSTGPRLPRLSEIEEVARGTNLVDLVEARLALEPQVMSAAAARPDPHALKAAGALVRGMRVAATDIELHATKDREVRANSDVRVHTALLETCRNPILAEACRDVISAMMAHPSWEAAREHAWAEPALPHLWAYQHASVYQAIVAGRPEEAERISREHMVSVLSNIADAADLTGEDKDRLEDILTRARRGPSQ